MKAVEVYDRSGRVIRMRSIAKTAREMGVSESLIYKRLQDGLWIHRKGYAPVKVRRV